MLLLLRLLGAGHSPIWLLRFANAAVGVVSVGVIREVDGANDSVVSEIKHVATDVVEESMVVVVVVLSVSVLLLVMVVVDVNVDIAETAAAVDVEVTVLISLDGVTVAVVVLKDLVFAMNYVGHVHTMSKWGCSTSYCKKA